jgi:hypothetical protein
MKKTFVVISLILNVLLFICEGFSLANCYFGFVGGNAMGNGMFSYFTNDSNILVLIASLLVIVFDSIALKKEKRIPFGISLFKFIASVSVVTTMVVVLTFLAPQEVRAGHSYFGMFAWPNFLFLHLICPLLALVSFLFFDPTMPMKKINFLYSLLSVVLYAAIIGTFCSLHLFGLPNIYNFMDVTVDWVKSLIAVLAILAGTALVGLLLLWIKQLLQKKEEALVPAAPTKAQGEPAADLPNDKPSTTSAPVAESSNDDVVVVEDSEDDELAEEEQEIKEEEEAKKTNPTGYMNRPRIYHIAKQDSTGKWQVRLATGQKAIKLFDTQAEAIAYAKSLVKTQGGSIRVHSLKGKLRKE